MHRNSSVYDLTVVIVSNIKVGNFVQLPRHFYKLRCHGPLFLDVYAYVNIYIAMKMCGYFSYVIMIAYAYF